MVQNFVGAYGTQNALYLTDFYVYHDLGAIGLIAAKTTAKINHPLLEGIMSEFYNNIRTKIYNLHLLTKVDVAKWRKQLQTLKWKMHPLVSLRRQRRRKRQPVQT